MQFLRVKRFALTGALALSLTATAAGAPVIAGIGTTFAMQEEVDLDGLVEVMPPAGLIGAWQIAGKTVHVSETTEIDQELGPLAVGVLVEVEGTLLPDGSIQASEVEVEDPDSL